LAYKPIFSQGTHFHFSKQAANAFWAKNNAEKIREAHVVGLIKKKIFQLILILASKKNQFFL
jgi:hypothetical protein